MLIALILFAIAAAGGLVMVALRLQGKNPPLPIALVHGALAAAGLVTLILAVTSGSTGGYATAALGILVVAALGGFFLFSFHLRNKLLPIPVAVIHAIAAVIGVGLLAVTLLGK